MRILALEFSTDTRSAAVYCGAELHGAEEAASRTGRALGLVERALAEGGVQREDVDCIAVGLGPGSYTGIRTAIALAQGWAFGRAVRLVGVSSMDALALQTQWAGERGAISLVVDAQRGELYWSRYQIEAAGFRELQALRLARWSDVRAGVGKGEKIFGPEVALANLGVTVLRPKANALALLAAARSDSIEPEMLEPISLRVPSFVKAAPARRIPPV
jgi:tRNA threonylcarbamoyl adenosine modification protein YeaZ